ncbi:5877_t:CDS:2, partial [Gigaspora margarita]
AGTAGCMLARELIHCISNINILVLEAGGPKIHANEQKMKSHVNSTKEVTVKKEISYPHGKVWGGCSQAKQYNNWAAQGPKYKIWDWDHCLKAFKALENNSQENLDEKFKQLHGFNAYNIMLDLIDATKNLGILYNDDFNSKRQNRVGRFQRKRCSLADEYLRDALKKVKFHPGSEPNDFEKVVAIDIRSYAYILKIIWDVENKGKVIICSSAINSP